MNFRFSHAAVWAFALCIAPIGLHAQLDLALQTPAWRAGEPFTSVIGVRELSSGEVIVIDARERLILLLSPDGSRQRVIAIAGSGPGEVQQPMSPLAMRADSTAVPDVAQRRVLVFDPTGKVVRHVRVPERVSTMAFGVSALLDGSHFFFPGRWSAPGARATTVPILRWTLGSETTDSIASIQRAALPATMREAADAAPSGRIVPYLPNDVLVASSGASFRILHAEPYRLSVISATGAVLATGAPVPITRVRTSDSERAIMAPGWIPSEKPPFTESGHFVDAEGRTWVRRSRASGATSTTYDVFSVRGEHLAETTLTEGRLIVGVGERGIYVVRPDEDGLLLLERHSTPK